WVDINLTVNQNTVPLIFKLLADPSSRIRQATAYALLRLVSKGLKAPSDKLQLIRVLSLGEVLESLETKSRRPPGSDENEEEELYREGLGKLANGLGLELVDLLGEASVPPEGRAITEQLVAQLLPVCIQFLADPFDDTSFTVFTFFSQLFSHYKKARKAAPQTHLTEQKRQFLTTALNVIVQKLKWDSEGLPDEDDYEDMDDDDRGAFEKMRQDLRVLLNAILEVDEELVTAVVRNIAMSTLSAFETARNCGQAGASGISWQDAELAVYLVYLYGELRVSRADKGRFNFVQLPPELVANKEKRKFVDSLTLPLTAHGEMMDALVKSNISTYPHVAVRIQFFESVGRYLEFFKARKECIMPVLHALLDERGMHQPKSNRRGRIFYVFHRFVKDIRHDIPQELVESLLNSVLDLLTIEVSQSDLESDNYSSSSKGSSPTPGQDAGFILEEAVKSAGFFDNQLYLFEAVGTLVSVRSDPEQQVLLQAVINPILNQLSDTLQRSMADQSDILSVLKVHHLLQALASVAKGFPEISEQIVKAGLPNRIESFKRIGEAGLVTLDALIRYRIIRDATRFTFTRLIAAAGVSVAQFIPTLTSRLLTVVTDPSEIVDFISFLGFVFYSHLGTEIWDMLDQLIVPLNSKVASIISASESADQKPHFEIKKAYLDFTLTIMGGPLYMVYISPRNAPQFEGLVGGVIEFAVDATYPPLQKSAFGLLAAFATQFGAPEGSTVVVRDRSKANAIQEMQVHHVPGFERVIYERLIPMAFDVPSAPNFHAKDPQSLQVLFEIGVMLKATHKARGQEVLDFLANEYLPSKNSPQETTIDFVSKLRDLDSKGFRKYFSDFVHTQCTESFYQREIEDQIRAGPSTSTDERRQMMELLKRFEEKGGSGDENDRSDDDDGDEDRTKEELANKLQGIDLDTADPNTIFALLSPAQRDAFMATLGDPSGHRVRALLADGSDVIQPWWESPVRGDAGPHLNLMALPAGLTSLRPSTRPSLIHNVFALWCDYSSATQGVSDMGDIAPSKREMARDLLSKTVPFLTDRKSKTLLVGVDSAWTYVVTPTLLRTLLQDALAIVRPLWITDATAPLEPGSNSPSPLVSSPLRRTFIMLSDVCQLFTPSPAPAPTTATMKPNHVTHKIAFYATHVNAHYETGANGWDLMIKVIEMKMQALDPKSEDEPVVEPADIEKARKERRVGAFIEE
ncbi:pre-tRNA nuclear export protein, partial [Tulasnella sp. 330]